MSATEDLLVIGLGVLSITVLRLQHLAQTVGRPNGCVASWRPSRRRRVEVRRLLDELPEAVLLVDSDHIVHSTNAAALALFDLARERDDRK